MWLASPSKRVPRPEPCSTSLKRSRAGASGCFGPGPGPETNYVQETSTLAKVSFFMQPTSLHNARFNLPLARVVVFRVRVRD